MPGELGTSGRMGWREVVLFLLTLCLLVLCGRILMPFAPALTWAVALSVATRPAYLWMDRKVGGRTGVSAAIGVVLVLVLIVVPVTLLADRVIRELLHLAHMAQTGALQDWAEAMAERHGWADRLLDGATEWRGGRSSSQMAGRYLAERMRGVLLSSAEILTQLAVMLFSLFFLYRDGEGARRALIAVLPMEKTDAEFVVSRMGAAISATLGGRLVIAAVQGAMGGAMFLGLGVPQPGVWGLMMAAAGMIPMVGTAMVWGPAAGYLLLTDHPIKAVVMVIWGGGVVGMVDNLLYPQLVGSKLQMHTLATFFAVLGGVGAFGVSGLVLGPLVMVATAELLKVWKPSAPVVGAGEA